MTFSAAIARGFSRPSKFISRAGAKWYAYCPTCNESANLRDYKGEASDDARSHNKEKHG